MFRATAFLPVEFIRILFIASLYAGSIFGWGSAVCRRFFKLKSSFLDQIAARFVIGCLVFYAAFVLMAGVGRLGRLGIGTVWFAGLVFGSLEVRPGIARFKRSVVEFKSWRQKERILFGVVCLLAGLQIVCGLTPLTFYDSQVYQLLAPVEFLRAGRLVHIPWNVLTNGPMALQLTFGMSSIADASGSVFKLLMTLFACLCIAGAARIGKNIGIQAALTAALFVVAYPEFWIHQTFGVVDLPVAAFLVFGGLWWLECLQDNGWGVAVLAGVAFGLVVASRYQGVVLVVWVLIAGTVVRRIADPKHISQMLTKGALVVAIVFIMVFPWLLRNYVLFGNPVFPVLYNTVGGTEWSAAQSVQLNHEVMGRPLSALPVTQILLAPIRALLMFPSNGLFGIPLIIGGCVVLFWRGYRPIRVYAILGLGGLIIWGLLRPEPGVQVLRFNAASILFLLTCTGVVLGNDGSGRPRGVAIAALLAAGSVGLAIITVQRLVPLWPVIFSSPARAQLWQANVPSWRVLEFANNRLDPVRNKILFVGETRALWLQIPFIAPSAYNGAQLTDLFSSNGNGDVWNRRLHELGITHILICGSEWQRLADGYGYFRLADAHLNRLSDWLHTLRLVFDDGKGNVLLSLS